MTIPVPVDRLPAAMLFAAGEMRRGKIWALSTQLYALRSERNWGIGDFTDLSAFAQIAGARRCTGDCAQSAARASLA